MSFQLATILIGGIATLAIYSFLIKENAFYRFFEHLFIGIAAGYFPIIVFKNFLWPKVVEPMLGFTMVTFPDGTVHEPYNTWNLLYLFPMSFGMLYYALYFPRFAWLAKLVIGFSLGYSGGLAFKGFFAEMMPQLTGSFRPLVVMEDGALQLFSTFENWVFLITLLSVMYYFFFTFRATSEGGRGISLTGRWLMMVCFGAFFGS
ncbi:MAG: hypothetical protein KDD70_11655, partial [Bdellovibrionales bacterium]|nr:hypothetical protein [Bdellovibrionales bacterium]